MLSQNRASSCRGVQVQRQDEGEFALHLRALIQPLYLCIFPDFFVRWALNLMCGFSWVRLDGFRSIGSGEEGGNRVGEKGGCPGLSKSDGGLREPWQRP